MKKQSDKTPETPAEKPKSKEKKPKRTHVSFGQALLRAIKLSFSNIWRNKYLTVATILVMGILIFIFNVILSVNFVAKSALDTLTKKVDIVIYLKDNVDYYKVQEMTKELIDLEGVVNVTYTSKSEALKIVSETHPKTAEFLARYGVDNPLPPSINVITEKPELHIMVQQFLNQEKYRHTLANVITDASTQMETTSAISENLIYLSQATNQIIFWIFVIFITGMIFIISNSIQLTIYNRQREIYIMRLVGATHNFIRLPFLFEGIIYGILGTLVAWVLLIIVATQIQIAQVSIAEYLSKFPIEKIILIELAAAIVLGVISSFIAVFGYLRKSKLSHS